MIRKWLHFLALKNNFSKKLVKKFFPPQIEAEHVLMMFLFFWRFQPGCSYKRCSYTKKGVKENWSQTTTKRVPLEPCNTAHSVTNFFLMYFDIFGLDLDDLLRFYEYLKNNEINQQIKSTTLEKSIRSPGIYLQLLPNL